MLAHCSPSSEWVPSGNTGEIKAGDEERNWTSYLTRRWLSISVLSNRHSPTYENIRDSTFTLLLLLTTLLCFFSRSRLHWNGSKRIHTSICTYRLSVYAGPAESISVWIRYPYQFGIAFQRVPVWIRSS